MAPLRQHEMSSSSMVLVILSTIAVPFVLLISIVAMCACCKKRRQQGKGKQTDKEARAAVIGGVGNRQEQVTIQFAINFLRAAAAPELKGARAPSCVFSPYALQASLAACMMGADGPTRAEMIATLFPNAGTITHAEDVLKTMVESTKKLRQRQHFQVFLRVYAHSGFKYSKEFKTSMTTLYGSGPFRTIDYRKANGSAMAKTTHQWLANSTRNQLMQFSSTSWRPHGAINSSLSVVSGAALNCKLLHPFYQHHTRAGRSFYYQPGKSVKIDMMKQTATVGYGDSGTSQVVRLQYDKSDMAVYILLPKMMAGLDALEKKLTPDVLLSECKAAKERMIMVEIYLPKFKMECELGDSLVVALGSLGLATVFKKGTAEFGHMLQEHTDENAKALWISGAAHIALIEFADIEARQRSFLDGGQSESASGQSGTSLTASIPTNMSGSSAPSVGSDKGGVKVFMADHPFLFIVMVEPQMTPLFYGRFCGPS